MFVSLNLGPSRRGFTRTWVVLTILGLAATVAVPLYFRHAARRNLEGHIASLRARGEPVTFADLIPPPLHDDQNAAFYINRAAAALRYTDEEERTVDAVFDFL